MIDYRNDLNPAQYDAATTLEGPVLVIAGAGSGKTRTIVYRLARLVESGVPASSILLLTFTRKAAQEMLERARILMHQRGMPDLAESPAHHAGASGSLATGLAAVQGGTFHSYAYSVLRLFQPEGYGKNLTVMDSHDILAALHHCREELKAGKGDRSFPKNQTIQGLLSKSRNKELPLEDVIRRDSSHLLMHADAMAKMGEAYSIFKREKSLLDYDDLLFELENVLVAQPDALAYCRNRHRYIMVDEYQDTNPVQARIAALVAGLNPDRLAGMKQTGAPGSAEIPAFSGNIMVVGDDAQSIYAFRGADVRNILRFPELFTGTRIIRLEENYRSTQPVLDLTNAILENATEGYGKHLYTRREGSAKPDIVRPISDRTEAGLVAARIVELLRTYPANEIAVLFRAGFHSYAVEVQLNKLGIAFRKYGGIRYAEAAHVKDVMSFMRLLLNPLDFTAFARMAELSKGVGAKTCLKLYQLALTGDAAALAKAAARYTDLAADLSFIDAMRRGESSPAAQLTQVIEHYRPRMEILYPDDHPRRLQGLEQLLQIAAAYSDLDLFVADLSLEDPMQNEETRDTVVLSTIHSAKGLEWSAVLVIDLVEERFPSRHALTRPEDFEEERRLMYVACTRAREVLELYVPASMYDRGSGGSIPAVPSPFVRELAPKLYAEWQEGYTGGLVEKKRLPQSDPFARSAGAMRPSMPSRGYKGDSPETSGLLHNDDDIFSVHDSEESGMDTERRTAPGMQNGKGGHNPDAETPGGQSSGIGSAIGQGVAPVAPPAQCGFCRHRIFGRGKIVQHLPPDKYRVNFPGIGLKVIMAAYLSMEE